MKSQEERATAATVAQISDTQPSRYHRRSVPSSRKLRRLLGDLLWGLQHPSTTDVAREHAGKAVERTSRGYLALRQREAEGRGRVLRHG